MIVKPVTTSFRGFFLVHINVFDGDKHNTGSLVCSLVISANAIGFDGIAFLKAGFGRKTR